MLKIIFKWFVVIRSSFMIIAKTFPQRYVMVILACTAIIIAFGQRVNLSLIITVMVKPGNKTVSEECGVLNATKADTSVSFGYDREFKTEYYESNVDSNVDDQSNHQI